MRDEEFIRKKRQSEVSKAGRNIEDRIIEILISDEVIKKECIVGHGPKSFTGEYFILRDFKKQNRTVKLSHSWLSVEYCTEEGEPVFFYMDADIVIYHEISKKIVCVISSKKSFRERGAQSAYWAIKKKDRTFPYILVTPDVENELFNPRKPEHKKKWRIILENEMDAVFIIDKASNYKKGNFYVGNEYLINYVRNLIK